MPYLHGVDEVHECDDLSTTSGFIYTRRRRGVAGKRISQPLPYWGTASPSYRTGNRALKLAWGGGRLAGGAQGVGNTGGGGAQEVGGGRKHRVGSEIN